LPPDRVRHRRPLRGVPAVLLGPPEPTVAALVATDLSAGVPAIPRSALQAARVHVSPAAICAVLRLPLGLLDQLCDRGAWFLTVGRLLAEPVVPGDAHHVLPRARLPAVALHDCTTVNVFLRPSRPT